MSNHEFIGTKGILKGKVALITGGAAGIGKATALLFAQEGAAVAIVDQDQLNGHAVAQTIMNQGGKALFSRGDVSQAADCKNAVEKTVQEFGGIHILFNNAGMIRRTTVLDTSEEDWNRVIAVNLNSVFLFSKYSLPYMIEAGGGVIINTGSGWGLVGGSKAVSYCASKAAVVNLTRAMAIDHGEQNIRVNCICPGDTETALLRGESRELGLDHEQMVKESATGRPLKRIGHPEDIAHAALYLVSDYSSFVTGTTLVVDGGGLSGTS